MRLDGKPLRRRLHPVGLAKAKHFPCELRLLGRWSDMFDYAVAEYQVEGTIAKLVDVARIALDDMERVMYQARALKHLELARGDGTG